MHPQRLRGLLLSAAIAILATACASMPQQQAYNREAHANIKTIVVLATSPTQVQVAMLNNPAASFGLIGGLIAAADHSSKQGRLDSVTARNAFEPLPYFRERLTQYMAERGYTLVWPSPPVQAAKVDRGSLGLRKAYGPVGQAADAQLDINLPFVGYAAAGAGANSPYRPTVQASVRLVATDGKQNLYTDYFAYNNVFNLAKAVVVDADPAYAYPKFDDLEAAGPNAIEGLRKALDATARQIASQM